MRVRRPGDDLARVALTPPLSVLVENLDHCDFLALRNMIIRTHLQDLKDVTNNVHYENYRCRKLAGLGNDGKSRHSNK